MNVAAPRDQREMRRVAGAAALAGSVLFAVDLQRDLDRCGQECLGSYRTFEKGHPWTAYESSWQWDAQNVLAFAAWIVLVVAFVYTLTEGWAKALRITAAGAVLAAAWIGWVVASPAPT